MPAAFKSYYNGFSPSKGFSGLNYNSQISQDSLCRTPEMENTPSSSGELYSVSDLFGLGTPRSASLVNQIHYNTNVNYQQADVKTPRIEAADVGAGMGSNAAYKENRTSNLKLDLSLTNSQTMLNKGGSPSSNANSSPREYAQTIGSTQSCRSDSPNSVTSTISNDSFEVNGTFTPMSDQVYANIQNLHFINCISSMSKEQFEQTLTILHTVLAAQNSRAGAKDSLEIEARYHKTAAVSGNTEASCTWSGPLPIRSQKGGPYSCKVFLGGVPWDITEELLKTAFRHFGNVRVEWPGKEQSISQPKGFAYIIFENDMQVKQFLEACREGSEGNEGSYFYKIPSRRARPKEVQVIPWSVNDSNYSTKQSNQKLDPLKTVFVGALHGMMNAEGLYRVMNDLFGGVIYAGIDTDKNKYPIGSGRVTFDNFPSYVKAVGSAFVDIKTSKFIKKVQIDPYLEDSPCSLCKFQMGPYFCRENGCFRYFCTGCWKLHHNQLRAHSHKPLMRNSKHGSTVTNAIAVPQ